MIRRIAVRQRSRTCVNGFEAVTDCPEFGHDLFKVE